MVSCNKAPPREIAAGLPDKTPCRRRPGLNPARRSRSWRRKRLAPAERRGEHLAGMVGTVVNVRLAENDKGCSSGATALRISATPSDSTARSVLAPAAAPAQGEAGALRSLLRAN
jgi:hypothetical protein